MHSVLKNEEEDKKQTQELRDTLFIHLFHMSSGMLGKKI